MEFLAEDCPVYAPDVPGSGGSDPSDDEVPDVDALCEALLPCLQVDNRSEWDLYAVGSGAALALALAQPANGNVEIRRTILEAPDFYSPALTERLLRCLAPPIPITADGSHLQRLWLMLRDELAFWPWFDKTAFRHSSYTDDVDWAALHERAVTLLACLPSYGHLTCAALRDDWEARLSQMQHTDVVITITEGDPRTAAIIAALNVNRPFPELLPAKAAEKSRRILELLGARDIQGSLRHA
jgi:pimeloyl-ACP methyl ester carboxylesterase